MSERSQHDGSTMNAAPFQIRGVVEGFYGPFYTFPERNDLIQFMGQHGFNLYVYGPKNDRQHRNRWREPYPPEMMRQFAETIAIAADSGITFCYAISPLGYDGSSDWERLTRKLRALFDAEARAFSVFVDDIACSDHHRTNCSACVTSAAPDAELCNRLYEWLQALDPACALSMCPRIYHGRAPFSAYLHDLGERLDPRVDVFYSGADVCSREITTADAQALAEAIRRAPLLWDNYPVNDLGMRSEMHIGPLRGRDSRLNETVRGVVFNPMLQPEASKIPLLTCADYLANPHGYDPDDSWARALAEVGGADCYESLVRFAENSLHSCVSPENDSRLAQLTQSALAALEQGERTGSPALKTLATYLHDLDESCYMLKHRMSNLRLRHELLPWIEALEDWLWVGKRALRILAAQESGTPYEHETRNLQRSLRTIEHQKRTTGSALLPLAQCVLGSTRPIAVRGRPNEALPFADIGVGFPAG